MDWIGTDLKKFQPSLMESIWAQCSHQWSLISCRNGPDSVSLLYSVVWKWAIGSIADSEYGNWGYWSVVVPTAGDLSSAFSQLPWSHTDLLLQIGSRDNSFKFCIDFQGFRRLRITRRKDVHFILSKNSTSNVKSLGLSFKV